ncbi:unnamed protein product [Vitrella brassicaformis CCMP3155]|uniref:Uncharacterized protein n=3 Tax=Vitrella brassicaformis TaxID=1169539 RepID=A0A0G4F8D8_VITBC|nr:unnamed protein product [Vitrella brassicaformis CCMP3155]|eukprot:CEM08806.1 unnamed protein product [Vitrella brassicaformis CCMP3155]
MRSVQGVRRGLVCSASLHRRHLSTTAASRDAPSTHREKAAVVFDIDGVLVRGKKALQGAKEALKLLRDGDLPFTFLTNGGGITESNKAEELTTLLDTEVSPDQVQMSHTPMREVAQRYTDRRVMVVGSKRFLDVAKSCGFSDIITPQDFLQEWPNLYPYRKVETRPKGPLPEAVVILHDPQDWALEAQVLCDILSGSLAAGEEHSPHLYASNPDFLYSAAHHTPRFGQGAFTTALEHLFEKLHGRPLPVTYYGKPNAVVYRYATRILEAEVRRIRSLPAADNVTFDRIYAIGDNPKADVRGANRAGLPWTSVLVRTGVFSGEDNDPDDPAHIVSHDVHAAVKMIVERRETERTGQTG